MGRRDLVFKSRKIVKNENKQGKMKHAKRKDSLNKFRKRNFGPLRNFLKQELFEREETYSRETGENPANLFALQNNGEYGLLSKLLELVRRRELRAFLVLLATCDVDSRDYIIESWKSSKAASSFSAFFPKSKADAESLPAEIWQLYKPPQSSLELEDLCCNSHFDFFTSQKEKEKYLRLYGIEGRFQPQPSFFLKDLNRNKFAYEEGAFYEQMAAEMEEFAEKQHKSFFYACKLSDEELLEAYDVSEMSEVEL